MPTSAVFGTILLLAGCTPLRSDRPAAQMLAPKDLASSASISSQAGAWPGDRWWDNMGDGQLKALIEEALAHSPDLAAAQARLMQAEGLARISGAASLPMAAAIGEAGETKQSYNNGFPRQFIPPGWNDTGRVGGSLNWDLDLFGLHRAQLRAAVSEREVARVEAQAARLALATAVAAAYADLIRLEADRQSAEAAVKVRQHSFELVRSRVQIGLDTLGAQRQSEGAMSSAKANLQAAEESVLIARHRIAALLGAGPDRGLSLAIPAQIPGAEQTLPDKLPLDLLGRRPDIVAARLRVEAAAARVGAARAAFYPNINLRAFIGFQSLGLDQLLEKGSHAGDATAAISLPLFSGGQLKGRYRQASGAYEEAVADYNAALIRALREVADADGSSRSLAAQTLEARTTVAAAEDAYRIAQQRYRGQLANYLAVLTAEDQLIAARRNLAALEARTFALEVELIRALGGGFAAQAQGEK